jgi:hypothetical protein
MIITKQKDFNYLLKSINKKPVFIVGCNECATLCHTGGEEEILIMKKKLEDKNIKLTGCTVLEPACNLNNDKRILRKYKDQINNAEKIIVFACGNGTQTVSEIIEEKEVIPGCDTLFLGEIIRQKQFKKRCTLCGECITDLFNTLCPISRCPKSMLNGPCGGSLNEKCEVSSEIDCIWIKIFNQLKDKDKLDKLKKIIEPKDWSKSIEMERIL